MGTQIHFLRKFITEILYRRTVIDISNRPQPSNAKMSFRTAVLDPDVGNGIRMMLAQMVEFGLNAHLQQKSARNLNVLSRSPAEVFR